MIWHMREKKLRRWFFIGTLIMMISIFTLTILMYFAIKAEIEECGGVAKCLGAAVKDFDEAREGE